MVSDKTEVYGDIQKSKALGAFAKQGARKDRTRVAVLDYSVFLGTKLMNSTDLALIHFAVR